MVSRVLGDRYELAQEIGSGAMATVWEALDLRLSRPVAVKVLHGHLASEVQFRARFQQEARHVASLTHPNIVSVHDLGADGGSLFIVMELVRGHSLRHVLDFATGLGTPFTARIARSVLAALSHAHAKGVIHRDVKPANILVSPDGSIKLTDFGIALLPGTTSRPDETGLIVGTAAYLSPEQATGGQVTASSDLYSAGCVIYECLAGRPPFVGGDVASVIYQHQHSPPVPLRSGAPGMPPTGIERAVMASLAKDPADRPAGAAEMAAMLDTGDRGAAEPAGPAQRRTDETVQIQAPTPPRVHRGRRWRAKVAVFTALACLGAFSASFGAVTALRSRPASTTHPTDAGGSRAPVPSTAPPTTTAPTTPNTAPSPGSSDQDSTVRPSSSAVARHTQPKDRADHRSVSPVAVPRPAHGR